MMPSNAAGTIWFNRLSMAAADRSRIGCLSSRPLVFGKLHGLVERSLQKRAVDLSRIASFMGIDRDLEGLEKLIGLYPWLLNHIERPPV